MTDPAFHRPTTIAEAVDALAGDDRAPLAGGATLMAILNAGLVAPQALVSLRGIPDLRTSEREPDGTVRLGAMRLHRETAVDSNLTDGQRVLAGAAAGIGTPAIRNMGTLGGSIAFADPAADYLPALLVTDAEIEVAGKAGARRLPAANFFRGWMETALGDGELVTGVRLPPAPAGSVGLYRKMSRVAGDFATLSVAVLLSHNGARGAEQVRDVRVAVGGCNPTPVRVPEAEAPLANAPLSAAAVDALAEAVTAACDPADDVRASAAYRRKVLPRLIRRTLDEAMALAQGSAGASA